MVEFGVLCIFLMCIPLAMGLGQSVTPIMNTNNRAVSVEVQAEITVFKRLGWIFTGTCIARIYSDNGSG